jgi:renalase
VVGAGVAGLACADALARGGVDCVVVDKSRGVGGRASTRRAFDARFDHGAQYCTARDDRFAAILASLHEDGVVRRWFDHLPVPVDAPGPSTDPCARWIGTDGMSSLPKAMAAALPDVRVRRRVRHVEVSADGPFWRLALDDVAVPADGKAGEGNPLEVLEASCVVWTPPVPQTLVLLDAAGVVLDPEVDAVLRGVRYLPSLTLLVQPSGDVLLGGDGAFAPLDGTVAWIADNVRKGVSPGPSVTVQATGDWSAAHFDDDEAAVTAALLDACGPWLPDAPVATTLHRWRYATPAGDLPADVAVSDVPAPSAFCGDAFGGGRIEGAFLSGVRAADGVRRLLGRP